jgi:multidrug resistance efflux pump
MNKPNPNSIPVPGAPKPPVGDQSGTEDLQAKLEALEAENAALKKASLEAEQKANQKALKKAEGALAEIKKARGTGRYSQEELAQIRAINKPFKVKALAKGFVRHQRVKPGQIFTCENGTKFSPYWMEKV